MPAGMNTRASCASRVRDRRVQWPGHACMRSDLEVDVAKEALNPVHEPAVARLVVTAAVHLIHGHDQVDDATSVPASCTHDRSALSSRTCGRKSHGRKSRHQALGRTLWGPHCRIAFGTAAGAYPMFASAWIVEHPRPPATGRAVRRAWACKTGGRGRPSRPQSSVRRGRGGVSWRLATPTQNTGTGYTAPRRDLTVHARAVTSMPKTDVASCQDSHFQEVVV